MICNGNRESLGSVLSPDSILVWHVTAFGRARRRMRAWQADPSAPPVVLLRSPAELDVWLAGPAAPGVDPELFLTWARAPAAMRVSARPGGSRADAQAAA